MFRDYYEVRDWLECFIPQTYTKSELGLARIEYLLKLLGNPEKKFKSIHIAGTSGKGSTAYYIARLLQYRDQRIETRDQGPGTRDQKVGLHVSPHLSYIGERMQIFNRDQRPETRDQESQRAIPEKRLVKLINEIKPVIVAIQKEKPELTPSYFEILVAMSFLYFAQEKVDWAVVEVGLGGRLDATNVLAPEVSVITNVGLDHTEILGNTIEKIAYEKAGIIKGAKVSNVSKVSKENTGTSVVTAAKGKALEVIRKIAKDKKAELFCVDGRLTIDDKQSFSSNSPKYCTSETAKLAVKTVETLGFKLNQKQINRAFSVGFPGRFEEIMPGVILDGAHNPQKIKALIQWTGDQRPGTRDQRPVTLVLAFKKGKNWRKMIDLLMKNVPVKKVIATEFQAVMDTGKFAAVSAEEIAEYVKRKTSNVIPITNSQEAVWEGLETRNQRPETSLVLVTGSLYLVGEAREMWRL